MTAIYLRKGDRGWFVAVDDRVGECLAPDEALGVVAATLYGPEFHAKFADHQPHPFVKRIDEITDQARQLAGARARKDIGFHSHDGGNCPVQYKLKVEALLRGGDSLTGEAGSMRWWHADNGEVGRDRDIVAYRIIEE